MFIFIATLGSFDLTLAPDRRTDNKSSSFLEASLVEDVGSL